MPHVYIFVTKMRFKNVEEKKSIKSFYVQKKLTSAYLAWCGERGVLSVTACTASDAREHHAARRQARNVHVC